MFIESIGAINSGMTIYETSRKLLPTFHRFWQLITKGNIKIVILGAGGVGKSTLAKFLSEDNRIESPQSYQESTGIENYSFKGYPTVTLIVPPGQERREYTWNNLLRSITTGEIQGVINVVSWGYHSFGAIGYQETKYYKKGMTKEEFLNAYLDNRRSRELEITEILVPHLSITNKKIWMLTLVTKQDLWWHDRSNLQQYYQEKSYHEYIQKITAEQGRNHFRHEYLSASLVISNFTDINREILKENTGGYDQNIQGVHLEQLLKTIVNCIETSSR